MNLMRKLRGVGGSGGSVEEGANSQHTALGLMHLRKLFAEFQKPPAPLPEQERNDKLYNMLPLFCKVFGSSPSSDMTEKFKEVSTFCLAVSQLMVSEIRCRAADQSTEAASCAIVSFLEIDNSEESSNGWMLLTTINLLSAGDPSLIQVMTSSAVPSTLVKCLYLFFDLPEMEGTENDLDNKPNCNFTPNERRILLNKIFSQVLVRLCSHPGPAQELARKNDLYLLFAAITSWCSPCNVMWRKSAAEVLMTLSRHGLTQPVLTYIHNKGCIAQCIENMQRGQDLTPLEVVEMFVSVFCCLKDSCEVAQTLLEDFRSCQGYSFLSDFLLKLETDSSNEAQEAVRNLVLMISSLTMCGYQELKPSQASVGSLFQLQGFSLPQPSATGGSVRNLPAFQVLQTVFLKSHSPVLCSIILEAISGIYHADNANYFILENQHTLPQFAEKIHTKSPQVQLKFFQQLEFIVFQLNFVPCKELISLSILLRSETSVPCSCICMQTLLNILRHNAVFKDVYREVGLLEVFVTCLQRYATLLKEKQQALDEGREYTIPEMKEKLGELTMEALTLLLAGNGNNAGVFRECGGARCAHNLVPYLQVRPQALGIVRELVLVTGLGSSSGSAADDDMATLLGMMYAAPAHQLLLKTHILQALVTCLRDSHRARTVFRKVGGFVYVMSVLVSMEGALSEAPRPPWETAPRQQVLTLLYTVFDTLTLAMRFEPANAKFFHQEIRAHGLVDSMRLLGCFSSEEKLGESSELTSAKEGAAFLALFSGNIIEPNIPSNIPVRLAHQCLLLRLMYDLALDVYERGGTANVTFKSPAHRRHVTGQRSLESPGCGRRSQVSTLNLTPPAPDLVVVHAGVVVSMLHLLPAIYTPHHSQMSLSLQMFLAEVIKSLVRSERNQQMMCEAGLLGQLLTTCRVALEDENHPLHPPLQYILERLASQTIEPRELREFLRLGDPLSCISMDEMEQVIASRPKHRAPGGPVPLTRIKTLVSMTTPRDFTSHGHGSAMLPPFVELDMSSEGFGCLYLPSIAPQSPAGPGVVTGALLSADNNVVGGIGSGDRLFPPQTGLSFSTWVSVDRFSDPRSDPHCVRLLTLVRNLQGRDEHLICLAIVLSARDKAIIISTQETLMPQKLSDWEPEGLGEGSARVWCPDLLQEGQWHHLVFVLNRAVLKNSSLSVYLDGQLVHSQKLHYISQNPGGGAANLTVASSVYAYIGTAPAWRRYSKLSWKQGPCHLVEEVLSPQTVTTIFKLGPQYMGSFQSPQMNGAEPLPQLISEEKLIFGLNAKAVSQLTLAKIRKVYSRADNKSIARQLGMSSHENGTPIRVLHNSVSHLAGPARSLGGVVVGYLGVRVFSPRPVAKVVDNIGGCAVLLGLIAMAQDVETLYAGVKALVCVVRANRPAQLEMDRRRQYQTLAMLLRKKKTLLNSHILHLMFSLVGTVDSGRETSSIPNVTAFQDLLCDLEVWHEAPGELERSLLEHLLELVTESSEQRRNLRVVRELQLVPRILFVLAEVTGGSTRQVMLALLGALLAQPRPVDLLWFGQFVASTLPLCTPGMTEKGLDLKDPGEQNTAIVSSIVLRNRCLQLLHSLLFTPKQAVNITFCDEMSRVLGLDWLLLFLQPHLHTSTVVWGLRILVVFGALPAMLNKLREGTGCGGWLKETELLMHNKMGVVLGCQLGTSTPTKLLPARPEGFCVSGFHPLSCLLTRQVDVPEVYFLLIALVMGQPVKLLPAEPKLDLDSVWKLMFGQTAREGVAALSGKAVLSVCPEAITTLLAMVRAAVYQDIKSAEVERYPLTIIEFLTFLYNNLAELMPVFMSAEVLAGLVSTVFPRDGPDSETSTPGEECPKLEENVIVVVRNHCEDNSGSQHAGVRMLMDFLVVIVLDSLALPVNNKGMCVIDIILESCPDSCTSSQQIAFQTDLLSSLMDRLISTELLSGEAPAPLVVPGGSSQHIPPNIVHLASRIVDKLWQDSISKDPHEVFDFVIKLISQGKRKGMSTPTPMEGLYHCLNRTILYLLSRPTESVADQMSVLEALHKLTNHRTLILGVGNHELDFVGCLTYCLLQLTADMKIATEGTAKTTWHVNPIAESDDTSNARQGHNLMTVAAKRVWEELYVCKKPAIEEVFKVPLTVSNNKVPDLLSVREHVLEPATKLWLNYIDMERKSLYRAPLELQYQIQSKIQKVTGGLTRLASRTKVKKESPLRSAAKRSEMVWSEEKQAQIQQQLSLVKELVDMRTRNHQLSLTHMQRYVLEEWLQTQTELTRERGLWGPTQPLQLDKWMLDMTEGPSRMRKKLTRNELFYLMYPYRPGMEAAEGRGRSLKHKVAVSRDSGEYYRRSRAALNMFASEREMLLESQLPSLDLPDVTEDRDVASFHGVALNRTVSDPDDKDDKDDNEADTITEEAAQPDNQTLIRLLDPNEKISHMFRCVRVQGLDTTEGLLLFGKEHLYVIDGFTLLKSREIRDIESIPMGEVCDPILPSTGSPRRTRTMRQCSKFSYDDIREVHKRRYLLQPMALEVFSGDGRNYLLAFPRKVRNKVYHRFMAFATGISDSAQQSVAGQKRAAHVEQTAGILSGLIGETSVTQRWVRGEISNFQYLMHLNTLAGRSYNDLMQYPVFPWILADYDAHELDLTHPGTFRDFAHPMGAQTPDRLSQFKKRFKEWDDPHGETPPYHYGTHYSSAMIVCSYLVRMEPFAQHFLRLQGGHFDLADRMFHSIKEAWLSASKHNMADVKELIPEFFYLPEFLCNTNNFDLGAKQNGVELGDVVLPPWAKGDPREFIRVHRLALECDYVSQHLHEWIDLIFGCKQNGQPAVDSVNVFHHLFYEGNVDIYNIDDPLKKNATIGFINNFGQIPKQLFKKPHPAKKLGGGRSFSLDPGGFGSTLGLDRYFFHHLDNLKPSLLPIKELKGPVGQILCLEKAMLAVEQNKTLIPPAYTRYVAWGFPDHSLRIGQYDSDKVVLVCEEPLGEIVCCACPSAKLIVTAGTDTVVTMWDVSKRSLHVKQCLYGHIDAVTCLAACPAYNVIVSGSRDQTAIVWDLSRRVFVRQLTGHTAPLAAVAVNDLTGDMATCAGTWLHLWSINGTELARVNTCVGRADRMQQILCVAFSTANEWDPLNVVITGSTDGVVRVCSKGKDMWSLDYVQVPIEEKTPPPDVAVEAVKTTETVSEAKPEEKPPEPTEEPKQEPPDEVETRKTRIQSLVHQMSLSAEYKTIEEGPIVKSGSESSLSEDDKSGGGKEGCEEEEKERCSGKEDEDDQDDVTNEHKMKTDVRRRLGCERSKSEETAESNTLLDEPKFSVWRRPSCKGDLHRQEAIQRENLKLGSSEEATVVRRRRSSAARNPEFRKSEGFASVPDDSSVDDTASGSVTSQDEGSRLRPSKSDTSLTDSFVVVGARNSPLSALREGFQWQRQLLFRSKLTMHTAYDRKDNATPASITALAVSKEQRSVHVGDARGRVFTWSVAEQPGRSVADHWLKDEGAESCHACAVRFSLYERKHHCRNCGQVFCSKCSKFESEISRLRILKPVRVCQGCYSALALRQKSSPS